MEDKDEEHSISLLLSAPHPTSSGARRLAFRTPVYLVTPRSRSQERPARVWCQYFPGIDFEAVYTLGKYLLAKEYPAPGWKGISLLRARELHVRFPLVF